MEEKSKEVETRDQELLPQRERENGGRRRKKWNQKREEKLSLFKFDTRDQGKKLLKKWREKSDQKFSLSFPVENFGGREKK